MEFQIITEAGESLEYLTALPGEIKHYKVFAEVIVFKGMLGTITLQSLAFAKFSIFNHDYFIARNDSFYKRLASSLLILHFIYKNNLTYTDLEGMGKIKFREGQFNLIYLPFLNAKMQLEEGEYSTFCIHFSKEYLEPFIQYLPALKDLLLNVEQKNPFLLSSKNVYASVEMREVINSILFADNHDELNDLYIEGKVQELLILAIKKIKKLNGHNYFLSQNDAAQIEKLKVWLNANMNNPGTLREMARSIGLNTNKVNKGFKQVVGITVFEYLLKIRLEKAKKLLLESDKTVTEIAYEVGYSGLSTFTRAFGNYFKYAPNYLRKK